MSSNSDDAKKKALAKKIDMVGLRAGFGLAVEYFLEDNAEDLFVVTADTSTSGGLQRALKKFPDNFIEVGISEQTMVLVAAGLALEGKKVICATFAPFLTMRALEQIRLSSSYMQAPVLYCGFGAGLSLSHLGFTHCAVEDLGLMSSLPSIDIKIPYDGLSLIEQLEGYCSSKNAQPTYMRITGEGRIDGVPPRLVSPEYDLWFEDGTESIQIISSGSYANRAISVFKEKDFNGLISVAAIKAFNSGVLEKLFNSKASQGCNHFIVYDEHVSKNSLFSLASAILYKRRPPTTTIENVGSFENLKISNVQDEIERHVGLSIDSLKNIIKRREK